MFCLDWHLCMISVVNALLLTCHSSVPTEGAEERSGLVHVTTQRLQRTSLPLGGHFRIQLSNTVIPGKGVIGGARFLTCIFRGIPRQTPSCEIVRQGASLTTILFIFQCLKMTFLKSKIWTITITYHCWYDPTLLVL